MADKVVRLGLGLVIWVWLARHFGPQSFGLWNYAIAFSALFGVLAGLGLDGVTVRELSVPEVDRDVVLGTVLTVRLASGLAAAVACVATVAVMRPGDTLALILVAANAAVIVLQAYQAFEWSFQAQMNTRPAVLAMNAAFVIASAARLVLLYLDASLVWFALSLIFEAGITAVTLALAQRAAGTRLRRLRFDKSAALRLLSQSWPLLLSGITVIIYVRLDQVMLSTLSGDAAVGQFSAALRISEVWYFIPLSVVTAAFPVIMKRRSEGQAAYELLIQRLYDLMTWLGIGVAVLVSLTADWLVRLIYGPDYGEAALILKVQIWAGVAISMSFVHGKWLLAEGLQKYNLVYTATGATVNVVLNLILIPRYGALGAAVATLATQFSGIPLQLLFPKARGNFVLMMRSFWAPVRWWRARPWRKPA